VTHGIGFPWACNDPLLLKARADTKLQACRLRSKLAVCFDTTLTITKLSKIDFVSDESTCPEGCADPPSFNHRRKSLKPKSELCPTIVFRQTLLGWNNE
jgi:hypothetical protein